VSTDPGAIQFDDQRVVANAGVLLAATLCDRLGVETLVDKSVALGDRSAGSGAGAKVLSLVHAMLLGADSIDDCDVLRTGETHRVLGHRVLAPSTLGTFLRSFTFGHVRQLDRMLAETLRRAWAAGAGPGSERLVIDLDSFVCEVHGDHMEGKSTNMLHGRWSQPSSVSSISAPPLGRPMARRAGRARSASPTHSARQRRRQRAKTRWTAPGSR
jgi:hypothetical protein